MTCGISFLQERISKILIIKVTQSINFGRYRKSDRNAREYSTYIFPIFSLLKTISVETKRPLCKSHYKVVQRKGNHLLIGYVQALFGEES